MTLTNEQLEFIKYGSEFSNIYTEMATEILELRRQIDRAEQIKHISEIKPEIKSELLDSIREKTKENKVIFKGLDGLYEADISDFIGQPTEGLLYDLNRDIVTVCSWIDSEYGEKWINDYAVMLVITRLKERLDRADQMIKRKCWRTCDIGKMELEQIKRDMK